MLKKLAPSLKGYGIYAILTPIIIIGEVIMEVFIPRVMGKIIDNGIMGDGGVNYVVKMGGLMVIMATFSLICGALAGKFASIASMGLAKGLRKNLFEKVQSFSFANIDKFSTSSLITRMTTDVTNTQNTFMQLIRTMVRAPFMMVFATIMAIKINPKLSIVFAIAIPVLGVFLYIITVKAYPRFQKLFKKYDLMNRNVQENLIAIRVVKAFVREDHENKKFSDSADAMRVSQVMAEKLVILNAPIMQFVVYACMLSVFWFGGKFIIQGSMLTGDLIIFISYIMQILMSLMMISMVFVTFVMSKASIQRIIEVLDEVPDINDDNATDEQVKDGSIIFDNVSFAYPSNKENFALEGINLEIKSGETIGIIGGTGSSKTSLVQLIPRFYDTVKGKVLIGGKDVKEYKIETLRNSVSMVLQKNVLFSGTIKENLKWGDQNATDAEITDACQSAQADDFVRSFPNGYETDLGQGGVNVSGGQKQRLCIARALLKKPKIIILDDSTSAVDTATDEKIRSEFKRKLADTTTIIIAQRISSVKDADKIVVMNDGKIDGIGTHDELMKTNEIYREVYTSQQKGADE